MDGAVTSDQNGLGAGRTNEALARLLARAGWTQENAGVMDRRHFLSLTGVTLTATTSSMTSNGWLRRSDAWTTRSETETAMSIAAALADVLEGRTKR